MQGAEINATVAVVSRNFDFQSRSAPFVGAVRYMVLRLSMSSLDLEQQPFPQANMNDLPSQRFSGGNVLF